MKILHTISGLSKSSGGPSSCTYNLLKGLNDAGVEADVLTIGSDDVIGNDNFIIAVDNDAQNPFVYSKNFRDRLRYGKQYDIYHANGLWTYPTHVTAEWAKKNDKPYIIAPHGMLYPAGLGSKPWKKKLALALFQRRDLKNATAIQATCQQEAEYIEALGFKRPIEIVPNCLDIKLIPIREKENSVKRFGFVGRINPIKNIDILLEAWAKLGDKTKDCELIIAGEGDAIYKKQLTDFVADKGLKNVVFCGFLSGNELTEMVSSFDYQLLVSKSENFGMVIPEALICGVPCIATQGTPWGELNSHNCGWWINDGVDNIASAIENAIVTSETIRKEMGLRGRQLVIDNYSVSAVTKKIIKVYEKIL